MLIVIVVARLQMLGDALVATPALLAHDVSPFRLAHVGDVERIIAEKGGMVEIGMTMPSVDVRPKRAGESVTV